MKRSIRRSFLLSGLLAAFVLRSALSAAPVQPPDPPVSGLIANASAGAVTVDLSQFPDFFGDVVPTLTAYYFDPSTGLFYFGSRALGAGEFEQYDASGWVAPGLEVTLEAFDFCTGQLETLTTTVGAGGIAWDGVGPMAPSQSTIKQAGLHVFTKQLNRDAVVAGSLTGDLDVDLGASDYASVGKLMELVQF
jgi:opacity protein-like surface antigen